MRIVREGAAGESACEAAWKVGHEHPARYVVPGGFSRYRGMRAASAEFRWYRGNLSPWGH